MHGENKKILYLTSRNHSKNVVKKAFCYFFVLMHGENRKNTKFDTILSS